MGEMCVLGEEDEAGGQYLTPKHLTTQADTVSMLNLHIKAHNLRAAPDERPQTTGTRVQKAEVLQVGGKSDGPGVGEGENELGRYKHYTRLKDQGHCVS